MIIEITDYEKINNSNDIKERLDELYVEDCKIFKVLVYYNENNKKVIFKIYYLENNDSLYNRISQLEDNEIEEYIEALSLCKFNINNYEFDIDRLLYAIEYKVRWCINEKRIKEKKREIREKQKKYIRR